MKLKTWLDDKEHGAQWLADKTGWPLSTCYSYIAGTRNPSRRRCVVLQRLTKNKVKWTDFEDGNGEASQSKVLD